MNKKIQLHALTFVMLFALYGIGFGLDRWLEFLREPANFSLFVPSVPYQLSTWSLGNLLLAFGVFWLSTRAFPALDRWALWLIAALGLAANIVQNLYWLGLGNFLSVFLTGRGYFLLVGALTSMAALFALYQMKKAAA